MSADTNTPTAYGLNVGELDPDTIPLEALVIVKCLDQDGDVAIALQHTNGLPVWDRVGLLTVALDVAREQAAALWRPTRDEDDDQDDDH